MLPYECDQSHNFENMSEQNRIDEVNRKLVWFLPELASEYGKYPIERKKWLSPEDVVTPKGQPCYIKGKNEGIKMDYVYGKGPCGPGYYHLCTKTAYVNLYTRIANECPVGICSFTNAARVQYEEWDDVKRIIHARQLATKPNDQIALEDQISNASLTAQSWHYLRPVRGKKAVKVEDRR